MFQIITAQDVLSVKNLNILIYGDYGVGKTSLANTAKCPLTLDFDKGAHRSKFRKDVFVVSEWKQIANNMDGFMKLLTNYDTLVIDTVDTLLDYMVAYIIEIKSKMATNKLQLFGELKDGFKKFVSIVRTANIDIIEIAHAKEKEENEVRIKRPVITGSSYNLILQIADFVGYASMEGNKRVINFNPTETTVGKNSANFGTLEIPDLATSPNFMANLIATMKDSINALSLEQQQAMQILSSHSNAINELATMDDLNSYMPKLADLSKNMKTQLWHIMQERALEQGFIYDKAVKQFTEVQ